MLRELEKLKRPMVETDHGRWALIDRERTHRTQGKISFAIFAIFAVSRGEKGLGNRMIISFQLPY